ncbi:helix-turn-helix domain-containing protein [Solimonas sp. SE-A11]|uniref:helix-turn-helix domain-containing protein n=1 Tax=Solimonas sp. SE-A11 TaxID=3054954 RepID=UPI00259C8072|nr:helix-turn-helix domain-containing protein [Solimonas sp. SE-A11]MDM4769133.1 helix-turn-helix domain-containing protein [Solimonas sp. SE-A11]
MAFDTAPTSLRNACAANCLQCPTRQHCLVRDLGAEETLRWNSIVEHMANLLAGKVLFEPGASAGVAYSVRAGCIKTFTLDAQGNERVRGFYLAGDIVGLDALTEERYPIHAVAIVPTQVCVLARGDMRRLTQTSPVLMGRLVDRLSDSLRNALALGGDYTAEQRVAAFLLQMQVRLAPLPGRPLRLPMGRRDIANYLRLATETVCRALTRFEQRGLLAVQDREITLRDREALKAVAEPVALRELAA